jgi:Fur family zinc uptake transcriptional regulator
MSGQDRGRIAAQLDAAAAACRRAGAQFTPLRRQVLELILAAPGPSTAYQLLDRLKRTHSAAAPPTIYRALDFLLARRLIHRLERLGAFIPCIECGHHLHPVQFLICHHCGSVAEIEDSAVREALEHAAARAGFHPGNAVVEIEGTCAACAGAAPAQRPIATASR